MAGDRGTIADHARAVLDAETSPVRSSAAMVAVDLIAMPEEISIDAGPFGGDGGLILHSPLILHSLTLRGAIAVAATTLYRAVDAGGDSSGWRASGWWGTGGASVLSALRCETYDALEQLARVQEFTGCGPLSVFTAAAES